jgi:hypothetical protein
MAKRNARISMLLLCGLILFYGLWCLRPMLIGHELVVPATVPSNAREMIEDRYPLPGFNLKEALWLMRHPFEKRRRIDFRHWKRPDGSHHSVHVPYEVTYEFFEEEGEWSFVRESPLRSVH